MGRARCRNFFGLFARLPPWRSPAPALHFLWISLRPNQTDPSPCGFPMPTMCELDCKQSQGCKRVRNSNSLATSLPCQGILWGLQGKWFQQSTRRTLFPTFLYVAFLFLPLAQKMATPARLLVGNTLLHKQTVEAIKSENSGLWWQCCVCLMGNLWNTRS